MIETKPTIVLTEHQSSILNDLFRWLDSDVLFHTLIGNAGTGKTTILKEFVKQNKYRSDTVITAPTHKAKKVAETVIGINGATIQSILGLRPNTDLDNFDINKEKAEIILFMQMHYGMLPPGPTSDIWGNIIHFDRHWDEDKPKMPTASKKGKK